MPTRDEKLEKLYRLITALETEEECKTLLEDLCTTKEIEKMAEQKASLLAYNILKNNKKRKKKNA